MELFGCISCKNTEIFFDLQVKLVWVLGVAKKRVVRHQAYWISLIIKHFQ